MFVSRDVYGSCYRITLRVGFIIRFFTMMFKWGLWSQFCGCTRFSICVMQDLGQRIAQGNISSYVFQVVIPGIVVIRANARGDHRVGFFRSVISCRDRRVVRIYARLHNFYIVPCPILASLHDNSRSQGEHRVCASKSFTTYVCIASYLNRPFSVRTAKCGPVSSFGLFPNI